MAAEGSSARRRVFALRSEILRRLLQRRLELDTDAQVWSEELGFASEEYNHYVPSQWPVLPVALRWRRPSSEDVFLDIGSGKGRIVLQAARYPFRRVIGLELSPVLAAIARENVDRNRARLKCHDVLLITDDLASYALPPEVTVVYAFHALTGSAFEMLLDRLESLAAQRNTPIHFIYNNPRLHARVAARPRMRLLRVSRNRLLFSFPLHLYEVAPPPRR